MRTDATPERTYRTKERMSSGMHCAATWCPVHRRRQRRLPKPRARKKASVRLHCPGYGNAPCHRLHHASALHGARTRYNGNHRRHVPCSAIVDPAPGLYPLLSPLEPNHLRVPVPGQQSPTNKKKKAHRYLGRPRGALQAFRRYDCCFRRPPTCPRACGRSTLAETPQDPGLCPVGARIKRRCRRPPRRPQSRDLPPFEDTLLPPAGRSLSMYQSVMAPRNTARRSSPTPHPDPRALASDTRRELRRAPTKPSRSLGKAAPMGTPSPRRLSDPPSCLVDAPRLQRRSLLVLPRPRLHEGS